ncbi:hypothetical protein DA2_1449 [Desulfovibrio sp. A2]|nr:hypothetical protein DA2_1449 [Desulfovibrio sp. A2]
MERKSWKNGKPGPGAPRLHTLPPHRVTQPEGFLTAVMGTPPACGIVPGMEVRHVC